MSYITAILIIGFLKYTQQVLYAVYLLQLKEYRHDRLKEHLLRKHKYVHHALFHTGIGSPLSLDMLPRPTGKASIIVFLALILGALLIYMLGITGVVAALLFSLVIVLLAQGFIAPIEHGLRQNTYKNARAKIIDLKAHGLTVIGITGSYGKTSTKDFITHILSTKFPVLSTKNSINTPLGVARSIIKDLKPEHKFFVVEMGAYKVGEIAELCDIALPDVGVITGISNQHLSLFGSQENIIRGKSELFDSLNPNGTAYINAHSPHAHKSKNTQISVVEYSEESLPKALKSALHTTNLPKELQQNVVPGMLIALSFGLSEQQIITSLLTLGASEKTMLAVKGRSGAFIIDDSHNMSEMGTKTAISYLSSLPQKNKLLIMPCIIELGDQAEEVHRRIGNMIKDNDIEAIITTEDYFDQIAETSPKDKIRLIPRPDVVCAYLRDRVTKDWAVVLEGRISPHIISFLTEKDSV